MRYTISLVQKIDSFNELVERIKRHKSIMIGEDADPKKEFTLVAIFDEKCNSNVLHIGVISEDHGLKPQCAINNGNCIIGVNDEVHIIFLETKINITRKLSSLFYEFIETEHFIVIVCELDVYVFDRDCIPIWSSSFSDIIEDYEILNGEAVIISCSNGDKFVFDLKDGACVQ